MPTTNVDFWRAKIARNIARDYVNNVDLELAGWRVIRIWECEIKTKAKREETLLNLYRQITGIRESGDYQEGKQEEMSVAAEPEAPYGE